MFPDDLASAAEGAATTEGTIAVSAALVVAICGAPIADAIGLDSSKNGAKLGASSQRITNIEHLEQTKTNQPKNFVFSHHYYGKQYEQENKLPATKIRDLSKQQNEIFK